MRYREILFVTLISIYSIGSALALDAPKLPPSAKKLNGHAIVELYDGHTISYQNFTSDRSLTGTDTFNFKTGTHAGTYALGDEKGTFKGAVSVRRDVLCHKDEGEKQNCFSVYVDGADIYEVDDRGVVLSLNHKQ